MAQWKHEYTEPPIDLATYYKPHTRMDGPSVEEQQRDHLERYRKLYTDMIDRRLSRIPGDMETLVKYIRSLMDRADPPLSEDELKFVSDAELIIKDQLNAALLEIALIKSRYRKMLAVRTLQAAE